MCLQLLLLAVSSQVGQTPKPLSPITRNSIVLSFAWSPDSKHLAYSQVELGDPPQFKPENAIVWIADADGGNRKRVPGQAFSSDFTWDGKSLIVDSRRDGKNRLFRYDFKDESITALTPETSAVSLGGCDPKGDWVAFSSDRDGDDLQVFVMHKDGSGLKKLTHGPGKAYNPVWSGDGKRLVYYRELGDQKDQIYVMDVDGTHERHLSNPAEHNYYPYFLPNGDVSYSNSKKPGERSVIIVDPSGKLKFTWPYETSMLKWQRRGGKAAFISGQRNHTGLFVADADGSNAALVSQ